MKLLLTFLLFFSLASCSQAPKQHSLDSKAKTPSQKLKRAQLPQAPGFIEYAKATKERLRMSPNKFERSFSQSYVDYMISGDPQLGQKLIKALKEEVLKRKTTLSSDWISIFGGGKQLKKNRINLGVLSSTRLMKLISLGDTNSIEFLVIYSAAVELNSEDSIRIQNYRNIIKTSYKEILKASILKNEAFLLDYPQGI